MLKFGQLGFVVLAMAAAPARSDDSDPRLQGGTPPLDKIVKIGNLGDQSGLYADTSGPGATLAAQMAVEDSGLVAKKWKIEILTGDHLNKADVGLSIARQWLDVDKVDVIVDVPNSGVALAVNNIAREKNAVYINSGAATSDLTNAQCSLNTVHWTYDTYMLAHSTGSALVRAGGDTWFFLTADYAFGAALERDASRVVRTEAGKVLGAVKTPLNTPDFSSFLLQAQASKAKIVGLANAGGDTANSVKQASEFGLVAGGQKLAALLGTTFVVNALGLDVAQGLNLSETFYWDLNDQTRAFSKRFMERMKNHAPPGMEQAGVYAGLLHYFKALEALGGNPHDGALVVDKMKAIPTDDPLFGKGTIRVDGRKIHPAYLYEVKTPSESKGAWDFYKLISTIPADDAFMPLSESTCPWIRKTPALNNETNQ
jgi:branched-chain amino acid transport system substrate-binding protein